MASEQAHRWYGTGRWQKRRAHQLRLEPLCQMCLNRGRITAATVVDHLEPHKDDPIRFWTGKVQSLCASCHSGPKIGPAGCPLDPRHPVYRGSRSNV